MFVITSEGGEYTVGSFHFHWPASDSCRVLVTVDVSIETVVEGDIPFQLTVQDITVKGMEFSVEPLVDVDMVSPEMGKTQFFAYTRSKVWVYPFHLSIPPT
jgi:superfamily I DNA and RNA helicase